ncbi:hypothetical protein V6N11_036915 [Hibiscus sabdariffa]|uniref:Uncharacterized protein n=1 Tax=Hibiscus sabdariffa TaxID=183260 RepID=A0ABR2RBS7_9ROSI
MKIVALFVNGLKEDLLINLEGDLREMGDRYSDAYSGEFPAAGASAELNPDQDKDFKEVSLSNEISTSREIKKHHSRLPKSQRSRYCFHVNAKLAWILSNSSLFHTNLQMKGGVEQPQKKKGRNSSMQTLKTAMLVSAVVVAVAGVAIVITKKLKVK